jgi:beta-lactam-binding protein with PASTA domain
LALCLFMGINQVLGQDQTATVPDITGLPVPQAVAALNRSGLVLGTQTPFEGTTDQALGSIVSQSVAAGSTATYGSAVDITLVQAPNARLIYDDNDITLVNLTE